MRLAVAFFLFTTAVHAAPQNKAEIVRMVEKRFALIENFEADFTQTSLNAALGETETATGRVYIKKPLMMRWEYSPPNEQTIVSDGRRLFFYVPADRQVVVEPLGRILTSRSPVLFLAGKSGLSELFDIEVKKDPEGDRSGGDMELSLIPKEKSLSVTHIIIRVDRRDYTIKSFSLFDWTGNRTDIKFARMKINGNIEDGRFVFKKPEGIELIEMPGIDFGAQ